MNRCLKKIIAFFGIFSIVLSSTVTPAFARDGVIGGVVDGAQSFVEWSVNSMNSAQNAFWRVVFGEDFNSASEEELKAAYDDYVQTLPATGYDSSGSILWSPEIAYVWVKGISSSFLCCPHYTEAYSPATEFLVSFDCANRVVVVRPSAGCDTFYHPTLRFYFGGKYPIDGYYKRIQSLGSDYTFIADSRTYNKSFSYSAESSATLHYAGVSYDFFLSSTINTPTASIQYVSYPYCFPVYEVVPLDSGASQVNTTYNINTRPTSITGGNYGIVGDNGQITKVEDNSTIINETNNTYYNPATGQIVPITGWSYDYSDRSYKVTMEGGKTSTVTYGDENISITETTVNESGDTITNNYTIYYLIDGSGSENPPSACEHDWQKGEATVPTCTIPGKASYVCSKCQQTKTESIPALGHDWQMKQTVTTQYDEEGNLTQQGYTIFECSRCHEQYKSPDGTIPPGGGSGTDPGEEGETIWDKLGNLIGAIGKGLIDVVEAVFGKILDALISLVEMMSEKIGVVVEAILSMFDELPAIFGGFLAFLSALFPFLPAELMTILTFGVIAIVFIGIIKAVRR